MRQKKRVCAEVVPWYALTDAATIAVDAGLNNNFSVTLGGNRTMGAPSNPMDSQVITFRVRQDGTGSRTLAWNAAFRFLTGMPQPPISTAAAATDYISFMYNSIDSKWDCIGYSCQHNAMTATLYTGSTTWTPPAGLKYARFVAIGGGGGGGSGRAASTASNAFGGGGGHGGAWAWSEFTATTIALQTSWTISIGAAGTGGTNVTGISNGNNGTAGGATSVAGGGITLILAGGGDAGLGGTPTSTPGNGGQSAAASAGFLIWYPGAGGGNTAAAAVDGDASAGGAAPGSGGGGGSINTANTRSDNGGTGASGQWARGVSTMSGGTAAADANGGNGTSANLSGYDTSVLVGGGGGGGGSSKNGTAFFGGNGGNYGGGGGGGGAGRNTGTSGAGGNGAQGALLILCYF